MENETENLNNTVSAGKIKEAKRKKGGKKNTKNKTPDGSIFEDPFAPDHDSPYDFIPTETDNGEGGDESCTEPLTLGELVVIPSGEMAHEELTYDEATNLTSTIRNAANMLWFLIVKAYEGKAWKVLGYTSWGEYVTEEFDMSRSRSYQIIDQAKVIKAIEAAAPGGTKIKLSEAAARDLKHVLDNVIPEIKEKTQGLNAEEAEGVVEEILKEQRETFKEFNKKDDLTINSDETTTGADGAAYLTENSPYSNESRNGHEYSQGGIGENYNETPPSEWATTHDTATFTDNDFTTPTWSDRDNTVVNTVFPPESENLDISTLAEYADAAQNIYIAVVALTDIPEDIGDMMNIISEEREKFIEKHLDNATAKLNQFAETWKNRKTQI